MNYSVFNSKTSYLEDNNHKEFNFNGETMTFTLQMIKIWTIKWAFKNLKVILFALVVDIDQLHQKFMLT